MGLDGRSAEEAHLAECLKVIKANIAVYEEQVKRSAQSACFFLYSVCFALMVTEYVIIFSPSGLRPSISSKNIFWQERACGMDSGSCR